MSISLSPDQIRAFDAILDWAQDPDRRHFVLGGYAGSGKTTLMREVLQAIRDMDRFLVHCCTPTGKAASVLQGKIGKLAQVSTMHSFLYSPVEVTEHTLADAQKTLERMKVLAITNRAYGVEVEKCAARVKHLEHLLESDMCDFAHKEDGDDVELVVVDEASMVGDELERDLLQRAGKVLWVGDPGQLPPVNGSDFFERHKPDLVLDQIHRQAGDSKILRLAHAIRHDEEFTDWDDPQDPNAQVVLYQGEPPMDELRAADVIITGKNDTRRNLNLVMRRDNGHLEQPYPQAGEPLMCLRNDHGRAFINGVPGIAASNARRTTFDGLRIDMVYEGKEHSQMEIDPFHFDVYRDPGLSRRSIKSIGSQFDYGYAITCHKSQGSEWQNVMVWDDRMRAFDKEPRKRWLYTAATRAAKKLVWVSP